MGQFPARAREGIPLSTFLERHAPEVVAATYWFDPPAEPPLQSVTIRFTGRRVDLQRKPGPGDSFVYDETLAHVVAGSGPIALTVKVRDVNPGEWVVTARVLPGRQPAAPAPRNARRAAVPVHPAGWSWRRWRLAAAAGGPVRTRPAPFVPVPAVLLGSWAVLVAAGVVLALVVQTLVISSAGLRLGHVLTVSLGAVTIGIIGAKLWFGVLHRRERRWEGWAVQGFVAGVAVGAPVLAALLRVPIGTFLDAAAPGLMIGLAVGRLGCFFTGCCAGRPTASRWGVWSSNRSIGARRVPTQLMEAGLALVAGLVSLAVLLGVGAQRGAVFTAAVAGYTLLRQSLLRFREEPRKSRRGSVFIAAAAAVILVVDLALLVVA